MIRAAFPVLRPMGNAAFIRSHALRWAAKQNTCPECGGWRGGHTTGCPEMPEPEEPEELDDAANLAVAGSADLEGGGTPRAEAGAGSISQLGDAYPESQKATDVFPFAAK